MTNVNIQDLERDPLGHLHRVEAGETLIVVNGERPIAEIKPVASVATEARPFGLCQGEFTVPADFDAPLPEDVLRSFEGE